jgi:hypothetical protein
VFTSDSRYADQATYTVTLPGGIQVTAVVPPQCQSPGQSPGQPQSQPPAQQVPLAGYARGGERLDLIAVQYLNAPSGFWRLCDANNALLAGALASRALVGIPATGTA